MDFPGKAQLPTLGVGLSFRPEIAGEICEHLEEFDFVEVILDNVLKGALDERFWNLIARGATIVGHGVNSSLGSLEPLDDEYLRSVQGLAQKMHCRWFSDHLAFTRSGGVDIGQLMPVEFSAEGIAFVAGRIRALSGILEVPFLLENIAYYFGIPGSTLAEIDFIVGVAQAAGCGLLLDVNNLYANSVNHGYDPYAFIDRLPAEAVVEIHVAGGEWRGGLYIDTHGHAVNSQVLGLLDYALATKRPLAVVLEREKNFPPMPELVGELRELRRLWTRHSGSSMSIAAF
jgi:uncharacterized protein (UPF0276 family)